MNIGYEAAKQKAAEYAALAEEYAEKEKKKAALKLAAEEAALEYALLKYKKAEEEITIREKLE